MSTSTSTSISPKWYYECTEPDCMKKFARDYDMPHLHSKIKIPRDKYNLILSAVFSTNLYCMTCAHKHAHRVYYNIGNPEPYNLDFVRG